MMKNHVLVLAAALMLSGCQMDNATSSGGASRTASQPESAADRIITQNIRQALMDDDTLSTNAKNVKIITLNGVVTLRGTVNSDNEKSTVEKDTKGVSDVKSVDNQLEVGATMGATGSKQ